MQANNESSGHLEDGRSGNVFALIQMLGIRDNKRRTDGEPQEASTIGAPWSRGLAR
jgi:hypothetical protein